MNFLSQIFRGGNRSQPFMGRRGRRNKREYNLQLIYARMESHETSRHCYIHPQNPATHWELNGQDRSYKRPVCEGCAA